MIALIGHNAYDYIYLIPFVEEGNQIFLKTAFPSRKARKDYLNHQEDESYDD